MERHERMPGREAKSRLYAALHPHRELRQADLLATAFDDRRHQRCSEPAIPTACASRGSSLP